MSRIKIINGREIIDSRGNPTIEVDVILDDGSLGRASVPSGASTGIHEVVEKRDKDKTRFKGKGVLSAVESVNKTIYNELKDNDYSDFSSVDEVLIKIDGTKNKSNLGGNAILGVSLAFARAEAKSKNIPLFKYLGNAESRILPVPFMNILNGGVHANNRLDIQEFMIAPIGAPTFSESLRYGVEIFHTLKEILNSKSLSTSVGDEGGFSPDLSSNKVALDLLSLAVEKAGYTLGKEIYLAIDVASSEFYQSGKYILKGENEIFTSDELISYLSNLCKQYPIISIEDGLSEDDWNGWENLTKLLGKKIQLVGDDLFATDIDRLNMGIKKNVGNSILIKLNQIGTLSETIKTINKARKHSYSAMISHRSGETEDTFISDLSVAFNTGQIKTGSLSRSDRLSKYNQLIRIEEYLGSMALFDLNLLDRFS